MPTALLDRRLLFVTGKGGVGKTTIAAALGQLSASLGQRTLLCEVDAKGNLAGAFETGPTEFREREIAPGLWAMSMDTEASLREYLRLQFRLPLLSRLGPLARTFDFVANAAPGVKEILVVGKLCHEVRERHYDLVVVDASASGHIVGQLAAPRAIGDLVQVGPVRHQTGWMLDILSDPAQTGTVIVATPEEMPVNETIDFIAALEDEMRLTPDAVVVNGVYPDRFREADVAAIAAADGGSAALRAALSSHRRARHHRNQVRRLRRHAPAVTLPFVFEAELGEDALARLATVLEGRLR